MLSYLKGWYKRRFSDPQVILLAIILCAGFFIVAFFGRILAPLLIAAIIAYLLDGAVVKLSSYRVPRWISVLVVFIAFISSAVVGLIYLVPLVFQQTIDFFGDAPKILNRGQELLLQLPDRYPGFFTEMFIDSLINDIRLRINVAGQQFVSNVPNSFRNVLQIILYFIVVPVVVFFLLKDKDKIIAWFGGFLPKDRELVDHVWKEMNSKIASYVRGKFTEIAIVWVVSYITFSFFGLKFAALLSLAVGLSVIIPYVGAVVVTLPILLTAYSQWGASYQLGYLMLAYTVIQFLDGNVLVPLLFSEVVNLHPVAILVAIIFFGGVWGIWGVFFAIPLATLIQTLMNSWPDAAEQTATS